MPFKIVSHREGYKIKNLRTGKLSSNSFKQKKNAQIQLQNRIRYENRFKKKT